MPILWSVIQGVVQSSHVLKETALATRPHPATLETPKGTWVFTTVGQIYLHKQQVLGLDGSSVHACH